MTEQAYPRPLGVSVATRVYPAAYTPPPDFQLPAGYAGLGDFLDKADYAAFTIGAFHLSVSVKKFNPLTVYEDETGEHLQGYYGVHSREPLFLGLTEAVTNNAYWNYVLHLLPADTAVRFLSWLASFLAYDPDRRRVLATRCESIDTYDPYLFDRGALIHTLPPRIPVVGLVVKTNHGGMTFAKSAADPLHRWRAELELPEPRLVTIAGGLSAGEVSMLGFRNWQQLGQEDELVQKAKNYAVEDPVTKTEWIDCENPEE